MRDIRADIRERLESALEAEDAARERVRLLRQMLDAEEARVVNTPAGYKGVVTVTGSMMSTVETVGNGRVIATGTNASGAIITGATEPPRSNSNFLAGIMTRTTPAISLDDFLVKAVRRGVHDKDELRDAAIREGYFPDGTRSPGRVIHAKLLHLLNDGKIQKNGNSFEMKEAE
jgi:hypothetical protein